MNKQTFKISYNGPRVDDGTMDIKELAPALLSISQLIEESNKIINGDEYKISLRISNIEKGSFLIELNAILDFVQKTINIFNSDATNALINVLSTLGFIGTGSAGAIKLLKKIKNRKPKNIIEINDSSDVEIIFDNEKITTKKDVIKLIKSPKIRENIINISKPLETEGIDSISFIDNGEVIDSVNKSDIVYLQFEDILNETINETISKKVLSIVLLPFREDNKWKVSDGNYDFFAKMLDEDFINRVQEGKESFKVKDLLVVELKTIQYKTSKGLKTEYEILKVLKHEDPFEDQISLSL